MIPKPPKHPGVRCITSKAIAAVIAEVAAEGPDVDALRVAKLFDPLPKKRHVERVARLMLPPRREEI